MNRTILEATVQRYHYHNHNQLRTHLSDFVAAHNFAKRLKTLGGLTSYKFICKCWQKEPDRISILRQSRRLYGCWPLKGAFTQPLESKSNRNSKCDNKQNRSILPELSNFGCHPGRAGGLPI